MKLHRSIFLLCALALAGLVSCESSTGIQQPQQTYKLEINPDTLVTPVFSSQRFRVRVTNYPTGNLYFVWSVNEKTDGFRRETAYFDYGFGDTGSFIIGCKAFEKFNDSLIAEGSAPVNVLSPGVLSVNLLPDAIDTTVFMKSDGSISQKLNFTAKIAPDFSSVWYIWNVQGMGVDTTFWGTDYSTMDFLFTKPGNYTVRVSPQKGDLLFGSDSCTVQIRFPTVDQQLLAASKNVSVYLTVDSSNDAIRQPNFKNPLAVGLPFKSDATHSYSLSSTSFMVSYFTETGIGTNNYNKADDKIDGEFSNDLTKLTNVGVSVNDTSYYYEYHQFNPISKLHAARYGFKLRELKLLAVTPTEIIYTSDSVPLAEFASDISFYFNHHEYGPCGEIYTPILFQFRSGPQKARATVVFTR